MMLNSILQSTRAAGKRIRNTDLDNMSCVPLKTVLTENLRLQALNAVWPGLHITIYLGRRPFAGRKEMKHVPGQELRIPAGPGIQRVQAYKPPHTAMQTAANTVRTMALPEAGVVCPPHQPRDLFHPQQRAAGR